MEYRVLARKYRPTNFDDLIGQEVLVRTLNNAITSGRVAHAFLLTGIRGIGKTTTARIIARALNCIGPDGKGGATISPCGVCPNCVMISEDRHVDVLEMDAASHTGVGDIREIIDTVRYLPTSARYKIYIIDEVHMLSNNAFNALLKTLEEPPPHVKFIFATTEARKIPVTILSRCQRFDLKRIDNDMMAKHLAKICGKEEVLAEEEALALVAVAAEGSVRDALSLLDQAIARGAQAGEQMQVKAQSVRQMIGSADNTATFRLIETLMSGNIAEALTQVKNSYIDGADPLLMVQDALEITHLITRVKITPAAANDVALSENDKKSALMLGEKLSMPVLARLWQMLLKGVGELRNAPSPLSALEMLLVRIAYAASLPTPAEVIRSDGGTAAVAAPAPAPAASAPAAAAPKAALELVTPAPEKATASDFEEAAKLFEKNRDILTYTQLCNDVRLVSFAPGRIELNFVNPLARDFAGKVADNLSRWTGEKWQVVTSGEPGGPSLQEIFNERKQKQEQEVSAHPLVASVFEQFPGAKLVGVKPTN